MANTELDWRRAVRRPNVGSQAESLFQVQLRKQHLPSIVRQDDLSPNAFGSRDGQSSLDWTARSDEANFRATDAGLEQDRPVGRDVLDVQAHEVLKYNSGCPRQRN